MVGKKSVLIWNVFLIQFLELLAPSVETTLNCSWISLELFCHFCVIYTHMHKSLSQMFKKNFMVSYRISITDSSLCIFSFIFLHVHLSCNYFELQHQCKLAVQKSAHEILDNRQSCIKFLEVQIPSYSRNTFNFFHGAVFTYD